ncbi:TPA: hypothetical protein ACTADU_002262 [Salmonella enterica subsp. enterica serovar Warragul]|nr:hypothetical protein [Salmonella enterica]
MSKRQATADCDSDHGGDCGAQLYVLSAIYRLIGIDPKAYLHHILSV